MSSRVHGQYAHDPIQSDYCPDTAHELCTHSLHKNINLLISLELAKNCLKIKMVCSTAQINPGPGQGFIIFIADHLSFHGYILYHWNTHTSMLMSHEIEVYTIGLQLRMTTHSLVLKCIPYEDIWPDITHTLLWIKKSTPKRVLKSRMTVVQSQIRGRNDEKQMLSMYYWA